MTGKKVKAAIIRFVLGSLAINCFTVGCATENAAKTQSKDKVGRSRQDLKLWYRRPAQQWIEALPVGNGRLGVMVFGGTKTERLQLNEDTLWSGAPRLMGQLGSQKKPRRLGRGGGWSTESAGPGMTFEGRLHIIVDGGSIVPTIDQLQIRNANIKTTSPELNVIEFRTKVNTTYVVTEKEQEL